MSRRSPVIALALVAAVFAAFWPALGAGFLEFDDGLFVTRNPHVLRGLTADGARWALTTLEGYSWMPATWLSHQAAVEVFGLRPWPHHAINVGLHAAAAVLLLRWLSGATGMFWPSALAAALFALHPLRVESVAWVAERKDVLSVFFALLSLTLWRAHLRRPGRARYAAALGLFALGLTAKPMLVSFPFVLLVLDWWPFARMAPRSTAAQPPARPPVSALPHLVFEKIPFFVLSAGAGLAAIAGQGRGGALLSVEELPLPWRFANAASSSIAYLGMALWPVNLSVFYPLALTTRLAVQGAGAALLAAAATFLALRVARRRPWVLAGWLWYLFTLLPVAGLAHVGRQALADRYTYLPLTGMFIALSFAVCAFARDRPRASAWVAGSVAAALTLLAFQTRTQAGYWRSERTLFAHALAATRPNSLVLSNLGDAILTEGGLAEALPLLEQAVALGPGDAKARNSLGYALNLSGRTAQAREQFAAAVDLSPGFVQARSNLGIVLAQQGRLAEAREQFLEAIRRKPDYAEAHSNLGNVDDRLGRTEQAIAGYQRALALEPALVAARVNLGGALLRVNRAGEAAAALEQALRIEPDNTRARSLLDAARAAGARPGVQP